MKNTLHFKLKNKRDQEDAFNAIVKEQESIGYYSLPEQDITPVLAFAKTIPDDITQIAVIGIGGSSLGAKAIYEFIKPTRTLKRELYFFESTDPINVNNLLSQLDLKKTHFLIISKSGTTVETFSIYKYIYSINQNPKSYTFITDPGSPLEKYAKELKSTVLHLPNNVGGRFSVLATVGLIPLALSGIDIKSLLHGASIVKRSFFDAGYLKNTILKKAVYYARNHNQYQINCIFAYSETLKYFSEWYVQLWGESLGKKQRNSAFNVGLTPIGLIGPKDQHSFLQLIMEGSRDKTVTFIKIEKFQDDLTIPNISLKHLEALDTLNNLPFSQLINMQCDSVLEALLEEDIPLDTISISEVNEENIGALMFYYELLTSLVGELINVNTYDQPGVESGKIILKQKLEKLSKEKL